MDFRAGQKHMLKKFLGSFGQRPQSKTPTAPDVTLPWRGSGRLGLGVLSPTTLTTVSPDMVVGVYLVIQCKQPLSRS
jgi:hypothetical protein